ncbi:MAG: AI-2E family transporter, partial [Bdellovibrionales bacterium]|nr:AI-2E family transporter [Bdellovibrionales bacterium]
GAKVGQGLGELASRIPGMIVSLVMAIVSLYFFLVDGKKLAAFARKNSFLNPTQTGEFMDSLATMARSVVLASVASGLAQSLLMFLGMLIAGAPNLGMVTFLVFLFSFLPLVGAAPVTFGVTLMALISGDTTQALILLVSAVLASLIDNFVRPAVLKGGANIHPMIGFIAAFGGLNLFGISGLFLGPIVAGMFMVVLRMNLKSQ